MDYFNYKENQLFAEDVAIETIIKQYGTPCYIYSRATFERHWHAFNNAFGTHPHLICYAVKANSNIAVLNILARLGSGFDIVSGGELARVLKAGGEPHKIVFSGVGKRPDEIQFALETGIRCFNVESEAELYRIQKIAKQNKKTAKISFRVNPNVNPETHPYISTGLKENKFGIDIKIAPKIYQQATKMDYIDVVGIDCHIGSQLTELAPFFDALERILELKSLLNQQGIKIKHLDLGGGLGVPYMDEKPPEPAEYASALMQYVNDPDLEIILEPGRAIAANAGILVTKVEYLKPTDDKNFAIIDAAMNDLIRPSLYQAEQKIIPINQQTDASSAVYDLVGPICETGDFLGKNRELALKEGDLLAIRSSGAYGFTMASNYNSRPKPPEIMVDGAHIHLIRQRESIDDLFKDEFLIP